MVRQLTLEQRIFLCERYFEHESARRARAQFIETFPDQLPPSRTAIHGIVQKFESTGSVQNRKHERRRTVLTDEKLDEISANLERTPTISLSKLSQIAGVSVFCVHRAIKLLKFKQYRFTRTHCLQPGDPEVLSPTSSISYSHTKRKMPALSPKTSGELITKLAKNVFIVPNGIKKLAKEVAEGIKKKEISIDGFSQCDLHPQKADDSAADWIFLIDTLNFCFWSPDKNNKWTVTFNGKSYTGYFALCAAIQRALKEEKPITDPKFYSKITSEELSEILRSDNPGANVPLLEERVNCLHEVGAKLIEKYNGTFATCLKECNKSAQNLLQTIVKDFACFKDEATYQGHRVAIYKRVQILIGDIWACFKGEGLGQFNDIESITMFADYRIPQVLIHYGAMKYTEELMEKLKADEHLKNGSEYEVEIRGVSIQIVELVADEVRKILKSEGLENLSVNSIIIDHFLWDYRRKYAEMLESIPYHKTLSIYY